MRLACNLFFLLVNLSWAIAQPVSPNLEWQQRNYVDQLKTGKITDQISMRDYLVAQGKHCDFEGKVFLVTLDNGLKAVYKLLPPDDIGDAYAEEAAYRASIVLGFPNIPPTVLRNIAGQKVALQLFIDTAIDALAPGIFESALKKISPTEINDLKIFYFVFGQWDTGPHNILIVNKDGRQHLIAIDNSGIRNHQYVKYGELPFVRIIYSDALKTNDWHKPFPFNHAQTMLKPTPKLLQERFGKKLPSRFYNSFKTYNGPLRYVVYRDSLWRQFHSEDKEFIRSYTRQCSSLTKSALIKLDITQLKKIFAHAKGNDFINDDYYKAILARRDQVLKTVN